jgi:hypothetical protein
MENWQYIMYDGMRSSAGAAISAIYFISWLFIGNFMLLNLFLAILLDSFVDEEEDLNKDDKKRFEAVDGIEVEIEKEGEDLIKTFAEVSANKTIRKKGGGAAFVK